MSKRTRAHRFTAANVERASSGLIRTGRSAASVLDTDLIEDTRQVSGYVRSGTVSGYAKSHFMVPQVNGRDVLYEYSLPVEYEYEADTMPTAVVAADLATSTDTRERSAGLQAFKELRHRWLPHADVL